MTDIARERRLLAAQGLSIVEREDWGAQQDYDSDRTVDEPARWFFLHISVTIDGGNTGLSEADDMRDIERIGQERFGIGFPYNAAIFDTGRLHEGQPLTRRGAHTVNDKGITGFPKSLNYAGRAIVLPQMVDDDVTDGQVHGAAKWAAAQIRSGLARPDATWYGHRDFAWKACPGDTGYARLPQIRTLTAHYVREGIDDEGAFMAALTDAQQKELYDRVRGISVATVPVYQAQSHLGQTDDYQIQTLIAQAIDVAAGVDDAFSTSGSPTRQQIAGTEGITSLIELALQRSPSFQALVKKIDDMADSLNQEPPQG